jgi:hypothetical protein
MNQPCLGQLPGLTLADATGYQRLRKLADSKFNILMDIRQSEDKVRIIDAEIKSLYHQMCREKRIGYQYQSGILDPVLPLDWDGAIDAV